MAPLHTFRQTTLILATTAAATVLPLVTASSAMAQAAVGATAEIRDASNRVVATAQFREGRGEVLINLTFGNPPVLTDTHAIHINDTGRCDPPSFASAGNIFNPFNKKHGRQNPEGAEVGDLPNVNFSTGLTSYNTTATGATLGSGPGSLLSPPRSIVIFSGEDDQKTDPEGNPGTRIACGVITPANGAAPAAPATGPAPGAPAAAAPGAPAAPAAVVQPTPTPAVAASVPRIASPVPAQPAGQVPQPPQPVAQPGQPAPANSPVVVPKPVVVNNNSASPSPVVAAAVGAVPTPFPTQVVAPQVPTPIVAAAAQPSQSSSGGLSTLNALLIAILGVGLVGVGWMLRQRRQLR